MKTIFIILAALIGYAAMIDSISLPMTVFMYFCLMGTYAFASLEDAV